MKVSDTVSYWHRPIGFPPSKGKKITASDIALWKENNSPNAIQKASYLTVGGIAAVVIGTFITILKETKSTILGAILALGGIGAIIGSYFSPDFTPVKENKDEPNTEFWINTLSDKTKSALERSNAAKVLGKNKEKSALNILIECLEDESTTVRTASAWGLGEIRDEKALKPLDKIAQSSPEDTSKKLIDTAKAAIRKIRTSKNLEG